MALRDPATEYREKQEALKAQREEDRANAAKLALAVLKSESGGELFVYLARRYHLAGRSFLTLDAKGAADPCAAAVRDGEKSVLWELVKLATLADPDFTVNIPVN